MRLIKSTVSRNKTYQSLRILNRDFLWNSRWQGVKVTMLSIGISHFSFDDERLRDKSLRGCSAEFYKECELEVWSSRSSAVENDLVPQIWSLNGVG